MSGPARIEAVDVLRVEMSDDGTQVTFRLVDPAGREVCLVLPASRLGELFAGIPTAFSPTHPATERRPEMHPVSAWSLQAQNGSGALALTLVTEEGRVACFGMTAHQLASIATISEFGRLAAPDRRLLN